MADDDNEIVIPVKVETDDAKKALDDLASTASETFDRVVAKQASNAGITPEEFTRRGRDFADNGPKYSPPESAPDQTSKAPPGPRERGGGRDGHEGHGVRYINVEQEVFGETAQAAAESTADIRLFREALHALHPALAEAGIGVGELSALVSAARGGFVALSVAIGTLVVTALERASDAANDAASRLGAFAGGISAGKEQYGRLSETADKLQTPTSGLVAPFEQITRLNQTQPQASQVPEAGLLEAIGNIVKGAQSERADTTKVLEALTKLLSDAREKGFLTPKDFKELQELAPKTTEAIRDQLPKGYSTFSGAQGISAIRAAGPQIDANVIEAGVLPPSISTAWEHVKASYEQLSAATSGGHALASSLDGVASFLSLIANKLGAINKIELPTDPSKIQDAKTRALPDVGEAPITPAITFLKRALTNPQALEDIQPSRGASFTAFDAESAAKISPAADKAAASLDKVSESSESLAARQAKSGITNQDVLAAKGTDLTLRQAEIDRKYERPETANKLERDKLSIQNADIHLEGAKISGLEAIKGQELSRLAPEEARERVASAQSNYNSALSKFFKNRGIDTTQLDAVNAQGQDIRELDAAATALKRAKIEQKYAYLEEPKADLAAQQAQTAIRSAELEKSDTSLRFNKDRETAPISAELQQLKYSEALLKEEEKQTKYLGYLPLLQEILGHLTERTNNPAEPARKPLLGESNTTHEPGAAASATTDVAGTSPSTNGASPTFNAQEYENNARRTGVRTVEGDHLAREAQTQPSPNATATPSSSAVSVPVQTQPNIPTAGAPITQTQPPPQPASQEVFARQQQPQSTSAEPQTKQQFLKDKQDQLDNLKSDFKSQNDLNENIARQNGGLQKLPPGGVSSSYPPSVPGHYDPVTQAFIPSNPSNVGPSNVGYGFEPKTNDFDFAGKHNPFPYQPGISTPITFPTYNKQLEDSLPDSPTPRPLETNLPPQQPQTQIEGGGQQFASLIGDQFQQIMDAVMSKLNGATAQPTTQDSDQPTSNLGIRGDTDIDQPVNSFKEALNTLTGAIDGTSEHINQSTKPDDVQQAADGGHIRGPGTSTSDSIPAMLSDGEFVMKEEAVRRIGVDNLHAMNDGDVDHFADGGQTPHRKKRRKHHSQFVFTDEDRIANDEAAAAYDEWVAATGPADSGSIVSAGTGSLPAATGGLITLRGLVQHFSSGGRVGVPPALRHFNLGGLASRISHATAPTIALASGGIASSSPPTATKSEMEHWGTIDMRTNHGDVRVATERDTMRNISSTAQKAKRYSTGPKPSFYGG